jgi:hypothetical protein
MLFTFSTFIRKKIDTFQSLFFRSISFIEANKKVTFFLVIFTYILGQLCLNLDISFFYKEVLSEDFSILNASSQDPGQGPSQESGQGSGSGSGPGGFDKNNPFYNPL